MTTLELAQLILDNPDTPIMLPNNTDDDGNQD